MRVEHRGDRHVDIARPELHCVEHRERVQHELPVREVHPLGQAGGATGVEGRRARVLVEVGKLVPRVATSEELLVLAVERKTGRRWSGVVETDDLPYARQPGADGLEKRSEEHTSELQSR